MNMSKTKEFIGGKFPKPIKEALKERADAAGMSMQEYVERVFVGHLDADGDQMISKEELQALIQQEVAALQSVADPEPTIIEEEDPEGYLSEYDELYDDPEDPELVLGAIQNDILIQDYGGLKKIFPKLLSEELNCAILRAWERSTEAEEQLQTVNFLEELADELHERAESPTKYVCQTPYEDVLPLATIRILDPVIIDAANEVGERPDKSKLFILIAELLHDLADRLYVEARAIEFSFDRSEYFFLDKMLAKVNKSREEDEQLADIPSLIRYQLGQAMEDASAGGLFTARDGDLSLMGKRFKGVALNRGKELV